MTKKGNYFIDLSNGLSIQTAGDGFETDFHVVPDTGLVIFGDTMVSALSIKSVSYSSDEHVVKENQ